MLDLEDEAKLRRFGSWEDVKWQSLPESLGRIFGLDEQLVEWFALSVLFATIPLLLEMCCRYFNAQPVFSSPSNIPELTFLTIMVNVVAAGDIRKVVGSKIKQAELTALYYFLWFGALISVAILGFHLWNEATVSDKVTEGCRQFVALSRQHSPQTASATEVLIYAQKNEEDMEMSQFRILKASWWLSGIFVGLSSLAEIFLARSRGAHETPNQADPTDIPVASEAYSES